MSIGAHRFIFVNAASADAHATIKIRYADALRANVREDDPARHDDHAFAMLLLDAISRLGDGEDITLNVFPREGETT